MNVIPFDAAIPALRSTDGHFRRYMPVQLECLMHSRTHRDQHTGCKNMLTQIIKNTPLWVWGLLVGLITLGVHQSSARVASLNRVMILPVIILFFFAQRYFIDGVVLSGLKG